VSNRASVNDQGTDADHTDAVLEYVAHWFTYHAQQRVQAFYLFLIVESALIVAYASLYGRISALPLGTIAMLAGLVVIPFWLLEVRNTELVANGAAPLLEIENQLRGFPTLPRHRDIQRLDLYAALRSGRHYPVQAGTARPTSRYFIRHGLVFRCLFTFGFLCSVAVATFTWATYEPMRAAPFNTTVNGPCMSEGVPRAGCSPLNPRRSHDPAWHGEEWRRHAKYTTP
jgi:hypothetical protein